LYLFAGKIILSHDPLANKKQLQTTVATWRMVDSISFWVMAESG